MGVLIGLGAGWSDVIGAPAGQHIIAGEKLNEAVNKRSHLAVTDF